jgi:hypothetical protein
VKFRKAWHKVDAKEVVQTIGVTDDGHVHLGYNVSGTDDGEGAYFAEFGPDDALRFAFELANLARYAKTVRPRQTEQEWTPAEAGAAVAKVLDQLDQEPGPWHAADYPSLAQRPFGTVPGDYDEWDNHRDTERDPWVSDDCLENRCGECTRADCEHSCHSH